MQKYRGKCEKMSQGHKEVYKSSIWILNMHFSIMNLPRKRVVTAIQYLGIDTAICDALYST